ncbi:MAG: hypothetical protein K2U26_10340 [Cyclobacteriaceae bacterium]|nr:hypothetical protein [Cyclobacteriaceae bacterium]
MRLTPKFDEFLKSSLRFVKTFCLLFLLSRLTCAQSGYGRKQLGVYFMSGNSLAIIPKYSSLNNAIDDQRRGFVGTGFYYFFQLRDDSTYNTTGLLRFMRVDFGLSNRAGVFELNPGNYALLNSAGLDLTCLLPLSFKAAKEIDAYVAVGPVFSQRYNWSITPTQSLPEVPNFKTGFALEMGFRLKSGSAIGYRTMTDLGDFSFRVGSIFFGFSPQNTIKRKKI